MWWNVKLSGGTSALSRGITEFIVTPGGHPITLKVEIDQMKKIEVSFTLKEAEVLLTQLRLAVELERSRG